MPLQRVRFGGKYCVGRRIDTGASADVYAGRNVLNGQDVAIKLESTRAPDQRLVYEAMLYEILAGGPGIPRAHWCGVAGDLNVLVLDRLGPSLEAAREAQGGKIGLPAVLAIAGQVLETLEHVHGKHLLHCGVRPDHLLLGVCPHEAPRVHAIDFRLARRYRDPKTRQLLRLGPGELTAGAAEFAGRAALQGEAPGRRDDLEALGLVLVYLAKGRLPWTRALRAASSGPQQEAVRKRMLRVTVERLCRGLPEEFAAYLTYCRSLGADDEPDYAHLRGLVAAALERGCCQGQGTPTRAGALARARGGAGEGISSSPQTSPEVPDEFRLDAAEARPERGSGLPTLLGRCSQGYPGRGGDLKAAGRAGQGPRWRPDGAGAVGKSAKTLGSPAAVRRRRPEPFATAETCGTPTASPRRKDSAGSTLTADTTDTLTEENRAADHGGVSPRFRLYSLMAA